MAVSRSTTEVINEAMGSKSLRISKVKRRTNEINDIGFPQLIHTKSKKLTIGNSELDCYKVAIN